MELECRDVKTALMQLIALLTKCTSSWSAWKRPSPIWNACSCT